MTSGTNGTTSGGWELLSRLSGEPEERLRSDPAAVARAFGVLGREALALVRAYASHDPAVREAAHRRWAELDAMLPEPEQRRPAGSPGLSERDRARLRTALAHVVDSLREVEREAATRSTPSGGAAPERGRRAR